jgi:sortase (surface protein transpeptidase)
VSVHTLPHYAREISPEGPALKRQRKERHIMNKQTATFNRDKETKNTIRFTAAEGSPVLGSLYVPKAEAGDAQSLTVTVEAVAPAAAPAA